MSPVATGKITVFNTTDQHIILILNGNPLPDDGTSDMVGFGRGLSHAAYGNEGYAPSSLIIPRSNATSINDPVFAMQNTLQVSFQGVVDTYKIGVNLAPPSDGSLNYSPSNHNLAMYIFYGYLILVDLVTNTLLYNSKPSS